MRYTLSDVLFILKLVSVQKIELQIEFTFICDKCAALSNHLLSFFPGASHQCLDTSLVCCLGIATLSWFPVPK